MIFAHPEISVAQRIRRPSRPLFRDRHTQKIAMLLPTIAMTYPTFDIDPLVVHVGKKRAQQVRHAHALHTQVSPQTLSIHIDALQKRHKKGEIAITTLAAAGSLIFGGSNFALGVMTGMDVLTRGYVHNFPENNGPWSGLLNPLLAFTASAIAIGSISFVANLHNKQHRLTRDLLGKLPEIIEAQNTIH